MNDALRQWKITFYCLFFDKFKRTFGRKVVLNLEFKRTFGKLGQNKRYYASSKDNKGRNYYKIN